MTVASYPPFQPHPTPPFSPSIAVFSASKLENRHRRPPSFPFIIVRSQTFGLLSVSLRSLVCTAKPCSPHRFARLFTNLRFALRFASLTCSHGKAVLTTSLRSFVRKPLVCSPLRPDGLASLKFISEYLMNFVATCSARLRLALLRLPLWVSPPVLPEPHTEPETQTAVPETRLELRREYYSPSIPSVV